MVPLRWDTGIEVSLRWDMGIEMSSIWDMAQRCHLDGTCAQRYHLYYLDKIEARGVFWMGHGIGVPQDIGTELFPEQNTPHRFHRTPTELSPCFDNGTEVSPGWDTKIGVTWMRHDHRGGTRIGYRYNCLLDVTCSQVSSGGDNGTKMLSGQDMGTEVSPG